MKKMFWILVIALCVPTGLMAQTKADHSRGRQAMVAKYSPKITAEHFLQAAAKGDTALIARVQDADLLFAKDKFGNNALHLSKNAVTVQAIAAAVRRLMPGRLSDVLNDLLNERNQSGEIPLMAHINYGKADTFKLLYKGTKLAEAIREAKNADKGGAITIAADIKQTTARALSTDKSGRTVAQAALANINEPGMQEIVFFFQTNARYLF